MQTWRQCRHSAYVGIVRALQPPGLQSPPVTLQNCEPRQTSPWLGQGQAEKGRVPRGTQAGRSGRSRRSAGRHPGAGEWHHGAGQGLELAGWDGRGGPLGTVPRARGVGGVEAERISLLGLTLRGSLRRVRRAPGCGGLSPGGASGFGGWDEGSHFRLRRAPARGFCVGGCRAERAFALSEGAYKGLRRGMQAPPKGHI